MLEPYPNPFTTITMSVCQHQYELSLLRCPPCKSSPLFSSLENKYYNGSFSETAVVSSKTAICFYSEYFFRKCHELITFKKTHYFIKWIFLRLFNPQNSSPKRTHTLCNIDSKWQRLLNTKSQETEDPPKAKCIQHIDISCINHYLCTSKHKAGPGLGN